MDYNRFVFHLTRAGTPAVGCWGRMVHVTDSVAQINGGVLLLGKLAAGGYRPQRQLRLGGT